MQPFFILLTLLLLVTGCNQTTAGKNNTDTTEQPTTLPDSTEKPLTPLAYQQQLGVGIDVDWAKTDQGRIAYQQAHRKGINVAQLFKERGFSHVRIRVAGNILDTDTKVTGKTLLEEIGTILDDCKKADLIPILAYQAKPFKLDPTSDTIMEEVIAWWQKAAETFKDYPRRLAYDLVIETTDAVKKHNDRLNLLYEKTTAAIRQIDPERIVIVAPNNISNPENLRPDARNPLIVPTPTDFMMVEWHFYAAGPQKNNPKKQWTTGTDYEKKLITDKIGYALDFTRRTGIPTWVGAWMATNYNKVNSDKKFADGAPAGGEYSLKEQKAFVCFVAQSLQKAHIPYAINSDTKYFDREKNRWYDSVSEIVDIILGDFSLCEE